MAINNSLGKSCLSALKEYYMTNEEYREYFGIKEKKSTYPIWW